MEELPCQEIAPDLFFSAAVDERMIAMDACRRCPLQEKCLQTGMATKSSGIWGGRILVEGHQKVRQTQQVAA